jgi:lipopolysaccharide exporter
MAKQASTVVLGYIMEPYRPRVSFTKIPEIFSFSFWNLFRNIGEYAQHQVGKIAIGGFAGAAAMGQYEVGRDLAGSPIAETCGPIFYALFPVIARFQHDREKRRELFLTVLYWSALICSALAIGIAVVADDFVDLLLGPRWGAIKPLVPWFAFYYGVNSVSGSCYIALESIGLAGTSARLQWMRVLGLIVLIFPTAFYFRSLEAVAVANFAGAIVISPTLFLALSRSLEIPLRDFARTLWRPVVAGVAMAAVLLLTNRVIPFAGTFRLLLDVALGACVFVGMLMALWFVIGRPHGPEHTAWQCGRDALARLRAYRLSAPRVVNLQLPEQSVGQAGATQDVSGT